MLASRLLGRAHASYLAKISGAKVFPFTWIKILTTKQMLQRLTTAVA